MICSTNLWFTAADVARCDGTGLVVATEYLGDAAVRDEKLSGDVARSDAKLSQLDDACPHTDGQRAAVDENPAQLVDASLTCNK